VFVWNDMQRREARLHGLPANRIVVTERRTSTSGSTGRRDQAAFCHVRAAGDGRS
jgi:hypothetical protein